MGGGGGGVAQTQEFCLQDKYVESPSAKAALSGQREDGGGEEKVFFPLTKTNLLSPRERKNTT